MTPHTIREIWKFPLQFPYDNCSLAARERGHISPSPPSLQYIKHWPDLSLTSPTRALGLCNFFSSAQVVVGWWGAGPTEIDRRVVNYRHTRDSSITSTTT